jgi:GTPase
VAADSHPAVGHSVILLQLFSGKHNEVQGARHGLQLDHELNFGQEMATHTAVVAELASVVAGTVCEAADVVVRRRASFGAGSALEVRVAIIGNVDSGKSTMVGVLTRSMLDDGRGLARSKVFKHGHEESTGRTSSIGQHNLCVRAADSSKLDASCLCSGSALLSKSHELP